MSDFDDSYRDLSLKYRAHLQSNPAPAPSVSSSTPSISPPSSFTSVFQSPSPLELTNINISKSLNSSLSLLSTLKSSSVPPEPSVSSSPSLSTILTDQISIKLCYKSQRLFLSSIPTSISSLRYTLTTLISSSRSIPLSPNDFLLYFYDFDGEKCVIDTDADLNSAYKLASVSTPSVLKLCIIVRRNMCEEGVEVKEESSDDDEVERFSIKDYELEDQVLMREGYLFRKKTGPYNKIDKNFIVVMYNCADFINGCTGKWENMPLMFNGEFGKMCVPHSIGLKEHTISFKKAVCEKYVEAMSGSKGCSSEILGREECLMLIKTIAKNDPNMTCAQILTQIKATFPNAQLPERKNIHSVICDLRQKGYKMDGGVKMLDINCIKTLRKTDFGREVKIALIDGKPKYFLHFYSDFQKQVADEVINDPNLHLFIDGTFKCCPKIFSQLLNVCVFHREKKLYIPICHVLMQTQKYEGYKFALSWVKKCFNINPHFITVDFETAEITAVKELFPDSELVPCFFHFVKCLWMNAQLCGLRKKIIVGETKQLIFSLKALAFRPQNRVYSRFKRIKALYEFRHPCFRSFLEYFESTWMDGKFQIKDWNYNTKITKFEDLAITNNGLESFHQIIKSQLRRSTPSFRGFLEVLCRAETLKKADYDEDKLNGDPQYNRCWPITKILKELYVKHSFIKVKDEKLEVKIEEENDEKQLQAMIELRQLKEINPQEYAIQVKALEKEVMFFFEEFDDNRQSLQQDSKVMRRQKTILEANQVKNDVCAPSVKSFCDEYLEDDPSVIYKRIEPLKETVKDDPSNSTVFFEDADEDLEKMMKGEFKIQNYDDINWLKKSKKNK